MKIEEGKKINGLYKFGKKNARIRIIYITILQLSIK